MVDAALLFALLYFVLIVLAGASVILIYGLFALMMILKRIAVRNRSRQC